MTALAPAPGNMRAEYSSSDSSTSPEDAKSEPRVGAGGFTGSPITAWCSRCRDHAVPMRDGTCGFCGRSLIAQDPPLELQKEMTCRSLP